MQNYDLAKNQAVPEERQRQRLYAQHDDGKAILGGFAAQSSPEVSFVRMHCFQAILQAKPHLPAEDIAKEAQVMLTFVQGGEK